MPGTKHAIVIGISGYRRVVPLKYADKDARDIADALPLAGFEQDCVLLLNDEDSEERPERNAIFDCLGKMKSTLSADDLLLFYFSGHGMMQENVDYLLPIDASQHALEDTGLSVDRVVQYLRESGASQVIMIIDSCRDELPTGKGVLAIGDNTKSVVDDADDGVAVVFSCASHERSFEIDSEDIKQSSFTHCLLSAIRSPEISTLDQAMKYLKAEVKALNGARGLRPQEPYLYARPDNLRELQIFAIKAAAAGLVDETNKMIEFIAALYGEEKLNNAVFVDLMEFLGPNAADDRARMRLVKALCELKFAPEVFQQTWQRLPRRATPPLAQATAVGKVEVGEPAALIKGEKDDA
jgi:Caspase domain